MVAAMPGWLAAKELSNSYVAISVAARVVAAAARVAATMREALCWVLFMGGMVLKQARRAFMGSCQFIRKR